MEKLNHICGLLLFLVLLSLLGCGTQDRYQVMEPTTLLPVQDAEWGTLTRIQTLWNGSYKSPVNSEFFIVCYGRNKLKCSSHAGLPS